VDRRLGEAGLRPVRVLLKATASADSRSVRADVAAKRRANGKFTQDVFWGLRCDCNVDLILRLESSTQLRLGNATCSPRDRAREPADRRNCTGDSYPSPSADALLHQAANIKKLIRIFRAFWRFSLGS